MQSLGAHHAPHYTVQALCARGKRAVALALPHKLCVSTSFLYWDTGSTLNRENEAKAKNTPLKQCLGMTTKPQNKKRKSKKHGELRHNEPPPVLHGNGLVE